MIEITNLQMVQFILFCGGVFFAYVASWCLWDWKKKFNQYDFTAPVIGWVFSSILFFILLNISFGWVVVK